MLLGIIGALVTLVPAYAPASTNHYGLTISTATTSNVSFNDGIFTATGDHAVLNVTDLENALANGNTKVTTDNGSGGDEMGDLHVDAAFSWSAGNALTLDAYHAIMFSATVKNAGTGDVLLVNNDGGSGGVLRFVIGQGRLNTNAVSINGATYRMASSVKELASEILAKPGGHFALSRNVDASNDGIYSSPPIAIPFKGVFNGLGHTISNLQIVDTSQDDYGVGLFAYVTHRASVSGVTLRNADVVGAENVGGLIGFNEGDVSNSFVSGSITGGDAGGLVGLDQSWTSVATIQTSGAAATVHSKIGTAGGLVGAVLGPAAVVQSFATGKVVGPYAGGLVGDNYYNAGSATIENCYATGSVSGIDRTGDIGGFVGENENNGSSVSSSYSIGTVSAKGKHHAVGGFDGVDQGIIANSYWDTETSGQNNGSGDGNETGLTGLTTAQFQSGLPAGFDPSIWAQNANVNNGFPYLKANPPPK